MVVVEEDDRRIFFPNFVRDGDDDSQINDGRRVGVFGERKGIVGSDNEGACQRGSRTGGRNEQT